MQSKKRSGKPLNQKLYNKVKAEAKKRFTVWPSAYASGWLTREYKRRGGRYSGKKPTKSSGLSRWFTEKWVDVCSPKRKSCGRPSRKTSLREWMKKYPYCRPSIRVNKNTPRTSREFSSKEKKRRCSKKRKTPMRRVF